jgi:anaphase-promoting complex subunit 3
MVLLQDLGKAYLALCQFECARALSLFSSLAVHHYNTGWVLCQVGRAHFEMAQYQKVWDSIKMEV